ncbi:DUF3971 domain-containing protein [Methylocystis sp. WRRC1]|uniref:DUF3971 domain-containing protein n=1 Tax=Methylocystis sp. WRRC1 TaxID=1732014 RepID=UPI001D144C26|nr:DUF3971 domain-containing protein [Methylocystis sp. WRRC1]MCC3247345.1 DUF3971 domain-containing protein [Methylocystis sp. WRRC1]
MTDSTERDDREDEAGALARLPRFAVRAPSRRMRRVATGLGLGALLLLCVSVGAFFLLLSRGPLTFSWLAPKIVESLDELAGGRYDFQLAGAAIANTDHGPTLSVDGLVVKTDGRAILAAPRAELSLDLASLLVGRIQPRRLEVLDLDLRLSVQADGAIAVSAGADPLATTKPAVAPTENAASPAVAPAARVALLRAAAGALRGLMDLATSPTSPIGALDRLGVLHGRLVIDDRTLDRVIQYNDVTLSLDKGVSSMRFSLAASGPSRRWAATAVAKGAPGQRRDFLAQLHDLSIDEAALIGGFRTTRFDTDAPMSLNLGFALSPDDRIIEAAGHVEVGHGFFRLEEPDHEPVMIDRLALTASWDEEGRKVVLSPIEFAAGGFDMSIAGEAAAPADVPAGADPGADAWTIALRLNRPTVVAPERAGEKIVKIEKGSLAARLMNGQGRVLIDKFAFSGPEVNVGVTGGLSFRDEMRVAYQLDVEDTQIRALARLWPTHVTPPVRAWFVDHVPTGMLKRARCAGEFDNAALTAMRYERPPPDDSVLAEGEIVNASVVDVLPGLSPFTGISGRLRVTGRTASFTANSGALETAPGRRLTLSEGRFSVADNAIRPTPAVVEVHVAGSVESAADLLRLPAISSHASLPIDPGALKGQVEGRVRVDFEIGDNARDDHTTFQIDATTSNLMIDRIIGKDRLEGGSLRVFADRAGLRVNGSGRIFGAPATIDLRRAFGEKGPAQAQVTLTFDEAARQRAGYVIAGISGPVSATIRTPLPIEDLDTQIELDLTRTTFDNPVPGVVKPAGKPAKASFLLVKRGEGVALEKFDFDAGPTQAQGVIELNRDGAFRSAKLAPLRLSSGDDMRVDIQRSGEVVKIVARGSNFDARPMLLSMIRTGGERGAAAAKATSSFDEVDVDFKSPIVTGHNKQILSNVDLKIERRKGVLRGLSLTGNFGREQLAVSLGRNQNNAQQAEISTNDGGSFLSFLDVYRKMDSGVLNASVQLGQNRADGTLRIRDFYVKGEPTMRQLMAQGGNARADDRGVMRFDPELVRIGRLQSAFSWAGGRLSVREGVMSGPEIGLTFDGFIDFPRDRIDLSGSYVPAYALNSLLSNIPVLGVVITGGQHEGIFALNYRVTGALSSPVVNVNPLSAIAPGLMRKIMGVLDGTARMPETR